MSVLGKSTVRRIITLYRRFGASFTLRWTLDRLGMCVYTTVKYPHLDLTVKTRPNTFWEGFSRGRWEPDCIKFLSNVVRENQIILDVGAWIGSYTMLFSKLMNQTGQVYAFEPDPLSYRVLCDHVKKNRLTNVHTENICLSNGSGRTKLVACRFGKSGSSMIGYEKGNKLKETTVKTNSLDNYCEEHKIIPDGIKIDVEGAEGLVIEGCQNIIQRYSPWILLEFHGHFMTERERQKYWDMLKCFANKIIFIEGKSNCFSYGSEVNSMPDCEYFHVFVQ